MAATGDSDRGGGSGGDSGGDGVVDRLGVV